MKRVLIWVFFILTCVLGADSVGAAAGKDEGYSPQQLLWLKETWTGDEKPYKRTRFYIDKWIRDGQKPSDLAHKYRAQATHWGDPLAQYKWAYPAYLAEKQKGFPSASKVMQDIRFSLARAEMAHRPRNYEYARLRFLAETRELVSTDFSPLAERLVKRNPRDYEVRFIWGRCMETTPRGFQMGMENIRVIQKAFPADPRPYMMLAGYYSVDIGPKYKNQNAIDQTIAAYRKVQSMAQPNSAIYKSAQLRIGDIRRMQKWHAEHPNFVGNRMLPDGRIVLPNGKIVKHR